jgi:Rod binding domain-containing protein
MDPQKVAITIPSDLVLDVMRNAAPAATRPKLSPAVATDTVAGVKAVHFTDVLHASTPPAGSAEDIIQDVMQAADRDKLANVELRLTTGAHNIDQGNLRSTASAENSPQKSFEQMFIRNMLESMLPAADSGIYGDEGISSGVWRSMAADQLASVYTNAGGLGIAGEVLKSNSSEGMSTRPEWPYFVQPEITGYSGRGSSKDVVEQWG